MKAKFWIIQWGDYDLIFVFSFYFRGSFRRKKWWWILFYLISPCALLSLSFPYVCASVSVALSSPISLLRRFLFKFYSVIKCFKVSDINCALDPLTILKDFPTLKRIQLSLSLTLSLFLRSPSSLSTSAGAPAPCLSLVSKIFLFFKNKKWFETDFTR